jgi:glycosyltransferase involved in cell wall biosynthesis
MNITFVLPSVNLTGGVRVVSIYAKLLAEMGHEILVISPGEAKPSLKQRIKSFIRWKGYRYNSFFDDAFFKDSAYKIKLLEKDRPIEEHDIPDADVVIATFWITAEWVNNFSRAKGKKIYFIQHHEIHPWTPLDRVEKTLCLPFKKVVVAQWIADVLEEKYAQKNISVVSNAVNHDLFTSPVRTKALETTFGFMYSDRAYKRSDLVINAFKLLSKDNPGIRLIAFGLEEPAGLPKQVEYYKNPEQGMLPSIYSKCDAWLFTSNSEGFGLPILEAMACRTPVIGTCCGAAPDLLGSGGGFLINIDAEDELLQAMGRVINMSQDEWSLMSLEAKKQADRHRWEDKVIEFEKAILSC